MTTGEHFLDRRTFVQQTAKAAALVAAAPLLSRANTATSPESFVSERRELTDPMTGRRLIQLTAGDCFDMPMYYFIPTYASDHQTIVFYRYHHRVGEIQLYKIDTATGVTTRLTNAKTVNSLWRPYLQPSGFGVRDLLSAINPVTNEAIYFDTNEIRAVNIATLEDRLIARVPEGRVPSGLTGVSPNGRYFCYPHFDRKWWEMQLPPRTFPPERWEPRDSKLVIVDTITGEQKDLFLVNFWITHSHFYDDNRILFCHNATDFALLMTDLRYPGQYENIRARSADGSPNHYSVSNRGVMYEMFTEGGRQPPMAGLYNPDTRGRKEYKLGIRFDRMHIGRDPEARLWFYETGIEGGHSILYFPELAAGKLNPGVPLIGPSFETYDVNQRSHYHPSVTPDRKHILFTGGDSRTRTNHLFLLDISDLKDTAMT
jgi:hypothetical protein